jgi:hypothetical protein
LPCWARGAILRKLLLPPCWYGFEASAIQILRLRRRAATDYTWSDEGTRILVGSVERSGPEVGGGVVGR